MIVKKGLSLIELIMVIAIIAVLAGSSSGIMAYTVKNSVFIPNQLNMDKLANDALDIMVEGNVVRSKVSDTIISGSNGLRFARVISAISANQLTFINQQGITVIYRWDTGTNQLYRTVGLVPEAIIPAYISSLPGATISGKSGVMFTYYDSADVVTATPANVRRIRMILIAKSGTGLYNDWEGQSEQATAIAVKRLQ